MLLEEPRETLLRSSHLGHSDNKSTWGKGSELLTCCIPSNRETNKYFRKVWWPEMKTLHVLTVVSANIILKYYNFKIMFVALF